MLLTAAIHFALCCFALALVLAASRLWRGPSAQDRILALDTMYINGLLIILTLNRKGAACISPNSRSGLPFPPPCCWSSAAC
jgi:multisubunit Na+/H+ antiporter MnhF subunit